MQHLATHTNFIRLTGRLAKFLLFAFIVFIITSCIDNEAIRGRLTLTLTDAPTDNSNIQKVNVAIRSISVLPSGSQTWQVIKSFESPPVVDLLEYSQGKLFNLTEQYLQPNSYNGIRIELNLAKNSNGLTVLPQSNIVFQDGSREYLNMAEGSTNVIEVMSPFSIGINQATFITLDFDVRKSIISTGQGYRLKPTVRAVNTRASGNVEGFFRDFATYNKVVVFIYPQGGFQASETTGDQPFRNSITSTAVRNSFGGQFKLALLPEGNYELVYVLLNADGSTQEILGVQRNILVTNGQTFTTAIYKADLE